MLNTAEVASMAHVPFDEIVPVLERARSRQVRPVEAIASGGRNVKPLGRAAKGGRKVGLGTVEARQHLHVVGATGTGKSTFMANQILSDIKNRTGVMVIDPKGDLINDVLDRLEPDEVRDRLVLIDPAQECGHGVLPLSGPNTEIAIGHFVGICSNLWPQHWGPRAQLVLRNGLRTILAAGEDLIDLPALMSQREYWKPVLELVKDNEQLLKFWKWWEDHDNFTRTQAIGPIVSRFDEMFGSQFMRNAIGKPPLPIDLGRALDSGGIVLARLPKGELPDTAPSLLGSILVAKAWQTAVRRSVLPDRSRPESVLYLDECQNFLTLPYAVGDLLAEARGLHMGMVLAHQHMGQLDRDLLEGISANARNKAFFNISPEDAHRLARHTLPELGENDLSRLDAFEAACRLVVGNAESPAFTLRTEPPAPIIGKADQIRREAAASTPFGPHAGGMNAARREHQREQDDKWGEAA